MGEFSPMHWLVVLIVLLLIFGPKRIPEIAKSLGEGVREFKKSLREGMKESEPAKVEPAQIESKGDSVKS